MSERRARGWALALTSAAFLMVTLDALVVVTALPAIQRDLHASVGTLEWTVNAFTLAYAAGIITAASLGDRFGRRRIFAGGIALFTAASAACALAPSSGLLVAARAVQGAGAAMVMPLSLTLLTAAFPAARRGTVVGIWGGIAGLGVAGGPLVGGAVTQGLNWHWIFWINVPIGIAATFLARLKLAESRGPATSIDLPGVALAGGGAIALVWGLTRAGDLGWASAQAVTFIAAGLALIAAFVAWQRRARAPMVPLRLFASRTFAAANATAFLMSATIFAAAFLVVQYFQFALGNSPLSAGLRLLPWTATPLVVAPLAGLLSDRIGPRLVLATGMLLQGAGLIWVAALATTSTAYPSFVAPLVMAGTGISMALPVAPATALSAVPPADLGKASGINSTLQRFGSAFGVAIAAAVFTAHGHLGTPASFTAGLRPALVAAAALSFAGVLTALAVGATSRTSAGGPHGQLRTAAEPARTPTATSAPAEH
jgi:EmrB/QacA subfamily drug resistance transporter